MHRRLTGPCSLALGALLLAGCSTVRKPATTVVETVPQPAVATPDAPLTREQQESKAEALAHYAAGVSYELKGDAEKALQEYFVSAVTDPANETFVLDVARRLIRVKKTGQAVELLTKLVARPGSSGDADALLGVAYAQEGKKDEALAASAQAIKKSPDQLQGYQNLFHLYLQTDKPVEALKALDDAAKIPTSDPNFLIDLADLYVTFARTKAGELEKIKPRALALLEAAAKAKPENPIVLQRMAEDYLTLGESQKGTDIFVNLLNQYKNNPAVRDTLRARLTDVYLRTGDRKKAAEQLEAIIKTDPTNPQAYFFLAGITHDAKEYAKSAEYYEKVILLNPDFEDAYYDLALTRMAMEQAKETIAILDKARAKFPKKFIQDFYSALAYNALKDYPNAIKHLTSAELLAKASEPSRLSHQFYFQLGSTYERNKDFEQAEKYFQECLRLNPEFPDALNYLGYMWAERGEKLDQALPLIEKAVKLEPDNGAYLDSLAWVLYRLNRPKDALPQMLKAIEKTDMPDATLYDHLGDIYAAMKQPKEAREAWQKALTIEPNPEIQKKLGQPTGKTP